jgi:FixJ family two-component response regulator
MKPSGREIFVVEDDPSVRDSLSFLLSSVGYDVVCLADGEALNAARRTRTPACILLDINLPGRSGLEILREFRDEGYPAPIVMMTGAGTIAIAVQCLKLGARDFIEKPFVESDLIQRLEQAIAAGGADAPNLEALAYNNFGGRQLLTRREQEVLHRILLGHSDREIGGELGISPRTAEVHRSSIMKKLGARSTTDLIRMALIKRAERPRLEAANSGPEPAGSPDACG